MPISESSPNGSLAEVGPVHLREATASDLAGMVRLHKVAYSSDHFLALLPEAVLVDYYARFLARFPDVQALAAAPLDDVLALWSGLGYYSRARNLHRCAQAVVADHGGSFPRSSALLATLPGIGRSTDAAIAAFCFGERAAILDGNVKRVLTRAIGFGGDLAVASEERALWHAAEALLPEQELGRYTQGLMDLGLLQHHLGQPNAVRVAAGLPGQVVAPVGVLPAHHPTCQTVRQGSGPAGRH